MSGGELLLLTLVLSLTGLVLVHLQAALRLARERPRHQALLGLLLPPLAPWLLWRRGHRPLALVWCGLAGLYAVLRFLAR